MFSVHQRYTECDNHRHFVDEAESLCGWRWMRAEGKISNVPSACKLPLILAVPYHFSEFILYVPVTNTQLLLPRSNHFAVILTRSQPIKQEVKTQGTFKGSTLLKGEGNGTPLQDSCLENPMDRGAWKAAVHGVAKSRAWQSDFTFTFHFHALEKEMETHSSVFCLENPRDGGAWWAAVCGVE